MCNVGIDIVLEIFDKTRPYFTPELLTCISLDGTYILKYSSCHVNDIVVVLVLTLTTAVSSDSLVVDKTKHCKKDALCLQR